MTRLLVPLLALSACTATIQIEGPATSTIYVTNFPTSSSSEPRAYICKGQGDLICTVNYAIWTKHYYSVYQNAQMAAGSAIPGELKVGPLIGGLFVWPALLWAYGPTEYPIHVD